jgi:hypothetical protein
MLVYKNGRVAHYKEMFPNVSFPSEGPTSSFLEMHNSYKVNAFKEHDRSTQKLVTVQPYIENGWAYTIKVENKTEQELVNERASSAAKKRAERDLLLKLSDWTQLADAPVDKEAWSSYRQALRDLPNQAGFPDVEVPKSPDWIPPTNTLGM